MNEDVVAVFIPIVAIGMSLAIPIVYRDRRLPPPARHRRGAPPRAHGRHRAWHGNRAVAGELLHGPGEEAAAGQSLLAGLIWLFVGIGLFVALGAVAGDDVRHFALIPGGIGLAFLIYYFVEGRKEAATTEGADKAAP